MLPGGSGNKTFEYEDDDDDDSDSDSGISQENNFDRVTSFFHPGPDLAKTELATRLASASPGKPAYIKARILWKYEPIQECDLRVEKGETVQLLHREGHRVFATTNQGERGFLPFSYCTVLRKIDIMTNGVLPHDVMTNGHDVMTNGHDVITHGNGHTSHNSMTNGVGTRHSYANGSAHVAPASKVFFHEDYHEDTRTLVSSRSDTAVNTTSLNALPGFKTSVQRCSSDDTLCHGDRRQRLHRLSSSMDNVTKTVLRTSESSREGTKASRDSSEVAAKLIQWDRKAPETYYRRQKILVSHFRKYREANVMVRFDFRAVDENDISVQRGEIVRVMNKDDSDWWWIARDDGQEGFVPSSYLAQNPAANSLGK